MQSTTASFKISLALQNELRALAGANPDVEVCGLLFGACDTLVALSVVRNVSQESQHAFEIDPIALIDAHRSMRKGGPCVIGCFHSHPNGLSGPSLIDADNAAPDGQIWLIIGAQEITAWRAVEHGALHGRFDPVPILRC